MAAQANITKQASIIMQLLSVVGAIWFTLEIGISEIVQVLRDSTLVSAGTLVGYGGGIDFVDKIVTFSIIATVVGSAGLGIYTTSTGSPKVLRMVEKNLPYIIGLVGMVGFWDIALELLQGNRTWSGYTDAENAYALFVSTGMAAGVLTFFGMNKA